jgi:hypothetical protein
MMCTGEGEILLSGKEDSRVIVQVLLGLLMDVVLRALTPGRSLPDEMNRYLDSRGFRPVPTPKEKSVG